MKRLLALILIGMVAPACAGSVQPLTPADVPALLTPPEKGMRVIALWALDCAYCETNLRAVAELPARHPDVQVVTAATDDIAQSEALLQRLRKAGAAEVPTRAYAGAARERLDFLVDPNWGGETPRTIVIHADGNRRAASGALTPKRLQSLMTAGSELK